MSRLAESRNSKATARYLEGLSLLESFRMTRDWGELESAEHQFAEASRIDPRYAAAHFYLGVSQEMGGKHVEAADQFEKLRLQVHEGEEPDFELLYNLGLAYFHQYHHSAYQHAASYLNKLIELTRSSERSMKRSTETVKGGERPGRRETTRLLAETVLAQVYSHLSILPVAILPAAILPAGAAEEQSRSQAAKYSTLAETTALEALEEFNQARGQLDPELAKDIGWGLHNALGHASLYRFKREGDPRQASRSVEEFTRALEFDPENYRVLSNLGSAYLFLAERERTNPNLRPEERAVERAVEHAETNENLELAERYFRRVLSSKPKYDFVCARLAEIALIRGQFEAAKNLVLQAKQHRSEMTPEYLDGILQAIKARERPDAAPA